MRVKKYTYKNKIPKSLKQPRMFKTSSRKRPKFKHPQDKKRSRWPLPSLIGIGSLLMIILVVPAMIVLPFMKEGQNKGVVEAEPAIQLEMKDTPISVSVMRTSGDETEEVPIETYVARVVASEMPTNFEMEALKAQGLAARTYIVNYLLHQNDAQVTDAVDHQVYKNETELREQWGSDYHEKMSKLTEAVSATEGEILTYNDAPITAAYFSTANGYTENSEEYWDQELPYLRSVKSPWDKESPKYLDQQIFKITEVEEALNVSIPDHSNIVMELSRTSSNRVDHLKIANEQFNGREVRDKLSLQSSDFTIKQNDDHLIFTTKGYGHGIGMSQYGANGMAEEGKTYEDIVNYYYKDIEIKKITDIAPTLVSNY